MCLAPDTPNIVERQESRSPDGGLARSQATTVKRTGRRSTILSGNQIEAGAAAKKTLLGA